MIPTSFRQSLVSSVVSRYLVTAPAVWGKLPSQGDYVHHRADMAERQAWHDWVGSVWTSYNRPQNPAPRASHQTQGWISLDAPRPPGRIQQLPIAFVMPVGALNMRAGWMVQGVAVPSADKVGRSCPFIVYQLMRPTWAARLWRQQHQANGQTLLFWWARLAWLAVQGRTGWPQWLAMLEAVWAAHQPGLAQCFGALPASVPQTVMQALLGPLPEDDPSQQVHGVYHLPWADWPQRCLRSHQPLAAYWTQDAQGGYVHAGSDLDQLWRAT